MPLVIEVKCRRRIVVTAAPFEDLLLAEFKRCFFLVPALKLSVVALVQPPVFVRRDPIGVKLVGNVVIGLNGPF